MGSQRREQRTGLMCCGSPNSNTANCLRQEVKYNTVSTWNNRVIAWQHLKPGLMPLLLCKCHAIFKYHKGKRALDTFFRTAPPVIRLGHWLSGKRALTVLPAASGFSPQLWPDRCNWIILTFQCRPGLQPISGKHHKHWVIIGHHTPHSNRSLSAEPFPWLAMWDKTTLSTIKVQPPDWTRTAAHKNTKQQKELKLECKGGRVMSSRMKC